MKKIKVGLFDIDGIFRAKYISEEKFKASQISGLGFCDVVFGWDSADVLYQKSRFTGWHTGYPDAIAVPDLTTKRTLPWEDSTDLYILDLVTPDGSPVEIAPRSLLRKVVEHATHQGYHSIFGAELEFYFYRETPQSLSEKRFQKLTPLSPGMFGYSSIRASQHHALIQEIFDRTSSAGIEIEGLHTETGPGVYEAALAPRPALQAADDAALFKTLIKETAGHQGLSVTFMAKVDPALPGAGGHLHQSLWDVNGKRNLFADQKLVHAYTAGLLHYMAAMMPLYCPTINSYKRLREDTWAPVNATWGVQNRTTAVRVIPGKAASARVELRVCGADINPYLAFAASLASGLEGIVANLELPPAAVNGYTDACKRLPSSLGEALVELRASEFACRSLGETFVNHYAATRDWEWEQFMRAVTNWEIERYFEAI